MRKILLFLFISTSLNANWFSDWFWGSPKATQFECPYHCGEWGTESFRTVEWKYVLTIWELDRIWQQMINRPSKHGLLPEPLGEEDQWYQELKRGIELDSATCFLYKWFVFETKDQGNLIGRGFSENIYYPTHGKDCDETKDASFQFTKWKIESWEEFYLETSSELYTGCWNAETAIANYLYLEGGGLQFCYQLREEEVNKRIKELESKKYRRIGDVNHFLRNYQVDFTNYSSKLSDLPDWLKDKIKKVEASNLEADNKIEEYNTLIDQIRSDFSRIEMVYKAEYPKILDRVDAVKEAYTSILDQCIAEHKAPAALYKRALLNFKQGFNLECIRDLRELLKMTPPELLEGHLESDIYLQKGRAESETMLFDEAIISLSKVIESDYPHYDAYLERAFAYFEKGNFDQAITDYLKSDYKPGSIRDSDTDGFDFALGILSGCSEGGVDGAIEFIPSTLASLHGMAHGLWSFATAPKKVSREIWETSCACVDFIRESAPAEVVQTLVPELQNVITDWNQLSSKERGEGIGKVIGKYGIEIFATAGTLKAVKAYRDLRKANAILTLERCARSEAERQIIMHEAMKRWERRHVVTKEANLKIQWDKQGKHIEGHRNYADLKDKGFDPSIITHSNPQQLIDDAAGFGIKAPRSSNSLGNPGYVEIVDFQEIIGFHVDRFSKEMTPTTVGKIHFAKDGVHIVPDRPDMFVK